MAGNFNVGNIFAELGIDTTIGADLAKARGEMTAGLSSFSSGITGALSGAATAIGYIGIAAAGAAAVVGGVAVNSFKNFEQAVANAASVTGLTGEAFKRAKENIAAVAQELGEKTTFSSSQAADALYNLASAGVDVANVTADQLQPILALAAGTQYDLADSVSIVTGVLNEFGLKFSDAARVSDILAASTGQTAATMPKLAVAFREVGTLASVAGLSVEQVTAALGVMMNKNMEGEQAGTGLKIILASLLQPTASAAKALQGMGLTFDQINPKTVAFNDIIKLLASRGLDATTAFQIFGREGAPAILALTSASGDVDKFTAALQKAGGTAETMANQQLDTLSGSLENMKGVLENVLINVGAALAPSLRGVAAGIAAAGPGIESALVGIVGFFTELGGKISPGIENVKTITRELKTVFGDIFNSTTGGQGNTTDVLAALFNGITQTIADAIPKIWTGINKVLAIFSQLKTELGPTIDNIKTTAQNLLPALSSIWDAIKPGVAVGIEAIVTALNLLSGAFATVTKFIGDHPAFTKFIIDISAVALAIAGIPAIVAGVSTALAGIVAAVSGGVGAITAGLTLLTGPVGIAIALIALLAVAWANDWGGIREKAAAVWAAISLALTNFFNDIEKFCANVGTAWTNLKTNLTTIWNLLYTACSTFGTNLKTIWGIIEADVLELYNYLQTQWNALYNYLIGVLANIRATLQTWRDGVVALYNQAKADIQELYNEWQARWQAIYQALQDAYNNIVTTLQNLVTEAGNKVSEMKDAIVNGISGLADSILSMASDFYNAGVSLLGNLKDGIVDGFNDAIDAAKEKASELADYLPHSPAKKGPFRVLPKWDSVFITPLLSSIRKLGSAGIQNLGGNLEGFRTALHKLLDTPAAQSSSSTSGGGVWSKTSTTNGTTTTQSGNMTQAQAQALLAKMEKFISAQAPVITIKDVKLDQAYNFNKLMADVEKYQTEQRRQRGAYI